MKKLIVAAALALAALTPTVAPAGATGGDYEHDGSASSCLGQIDRRLHDLDKLLSKVASAHDVTAEHRATLTAALQEARAGLAALRAEVVALAATTTTTVATATLTPQTEEHEYDGAMTPEVAAACRRMFTEFRVYVLRKPQVHLVLSADRVVGQRALFDLLASELEAAIAAAGSDPDVAEARRLLDEYRAKIDAAWQGASGVSGAVVGLGPADWNADPAVLCTYVDVMRQVKHDLKTAKKDARQIVALLSDAGAKTSGKA
jgi:hypothetical protein